MSTKVSYTNAIEDETFAIEDDSWWFKHRKQIIESAVKRFSRSNQFVEIGSGNGVISKYLQDLGFEVVAYEPLEAGAENAKSRGVKKVINDFFSCESVPANSIGNIGIFDVLEHIEEERIFLSHIFHALSDEGALFITVPAFRGLYSSVDDYLGHYRRYNIDSLRRVLKESGFDVRYCTYFFSIAYPPILVFRHLPYILGEVTKRRNSPRKIRRVKRSEHILPGFINKIVETLLSFEDSAVKRGKTIPFGSSILCYAVKNNNT